MFKMLVVVVAVSCALVWAVKAQRILPGYRMTGLIDTILAGAMGLIAFDFIIVFARACGIRISRLFESTSLWIIGIVYALFGLWLFMVGTPEHFAYLDYITDRCLQPFWVLVIIRFFIPNKPQK